MNAKLPTTASEEALFLSKALFLAHIDPSDLERLVPHLRRKFYARGEVVFHRGDLPGDCFFVVNGTVKACSRLEDGRELIYIIWTRGDSFGIYDIYWELRHNVDVIALEPTEVFAVRGEELVAFMKTDPEWLSTAFISYSRTRYAQFERVQDLVFLQGRERLCKAIVQHAVDTDCGESGVAILKKPMSQSQLAAFTGNSRESVNRWLKGLVRDGIVRLDKDGIVVLEPELLRRQYPNFE